MHMDDSKKLKALEAKTAKLEENGKRLEEQGELLEKKMKEDKLSYNKEVKAWEESRGKIWEELLAEKEKFRQKENLSHELDKQRLDLMEKVDELREEVQKLAPYHLILELKRKLERCPMDHEAVHAIMTACPVCGHKV